MWLCKPVCLNALTRRMAPLPSTSRLLSALSISHRTFFESLKYLAHRLADVSSSTAFLIHPVCSLAGGFDKCTWATMNSFGFVLADTRYSIRTGLKSRDFYRVSCDVVTVPTDKRARTCHRSTIDQSRSAPRLQATRIAWTGKVLSLYEASSRFVVYEG
ncbi:hypothetical protein IW262DRAFT_1059540 [Armillaria fumosa]|nr:hypothetical protein IW262DRAFT_1059540 [Armillaria fumosa]